MLRKVLVATKKHPIITFVVISFAAIVVFVAIKVSANSREAVNVASCRSHMKLIGAGAQNALAKDGRFIAATSGNPPISWRVTMLPYLDLKDVHAMYHGRISWDSSENGRVAETSVTIYQCPSYGQKSAASTQVDDRHRYLAQYAMMTGRNTAGRGVTPDEITGGLSNTIIIGEACDLRIIWTEPRDVSIGEQAPGVNLAPPKVGWLSSQHSLGSHALFADGHVRMIAKDTDSKALKALVAINADAKVDGY